MKLEIIITPTGNPTPNRNWDWEAYKAFAATEMGLSLPETDEEWEDAA